MKKKILVVGLSNVIGGVERTVLQIVNSLYDCIDFDFLCYGSRFQYENQYNKSNFFYLEKRSKSYIKSQKQLKKFFELNKNTYDYIWINTSSCSNISVHKYAKKYTNSKVITHSHSSKIEHNNLVLKMIHYLLHYLNRYKLIKLTDIMIACSLNAGIHLYGKNTKNIKILHNCIDVDKFKFGNEKRKKIRSQLNINKDDLVLCSVGRLVKVKNVYFTLKVFEKLYDQNKNSYLLIVGDGPLMAKLKKYCIDSNLSNVKFLGYQDNVVDYLCASDILLQPSYFEGFPVNILESQANGLKCIISDKITDEVCLTDLVKKLPICKFDYEKWSYECMNIMSVNRSMYNNKIKEFCLDTSNCSVNFLKILK